MVLNKILIVADTLDVNGSSGGKASMALVKGFIEEGYQVTVLHYSRKEIAITGADVISIKEYKNSLVYVLAKLQMLFQRVTGRNINQWIEERRGFSFTHTYDVISIKKTLKRQIPSAYNVIIALSYASSFRAHRAILEMPQWHEKFLPYIHDPYPMHSYPRPYDWVEPGHQYKRDFFVDLYTVSHKIMYPSLLLSEWMESYYPTGKDKGVIIPHLITNDLRDTQNYPPYFDKIKFNILHAGSLMSARNPLSLVYAFVTCLETSEEFSKNANLLIVGGASIFHQEMRKLAAHYPQLVISEVKEPFEVTYNMQQATSVNVILEAKGPASPFLPGKVPHCVAGNNPILLLGPYYSETKRILGEEYKYWSEIDDSATIQKHLLDLFNDWKIKEGNTVLECMTITNYLKSGSIRKVLNSAHL